MTGDTRPPAPADAPPPATSTSRADQVTALAAYLVANRGLFTDEALDQAALDGGYPKDVLAEARARAGADPTPAIRQRARRWVLAAYGVTFLLLVLGMFANPAARSYGGNVIGTMILAFSLGLALAIALWVVRRARPSPDVTGATVMTGILAIPILLLVIVAGMCVATGLPIPRSY